MLDSISDLLHVDEAVHVHQLEQRGGVNDKAESDARATLASFWVCVPLPSTTSPGRPSLTGLEAPLHQCERVVTMRPTA